MRYTIKMEAFLVRHYRGVVIIALAILIGLSFYAGSLYSAYEKKGDRVTLSCDDSVLKALTIPTQAFAQGDIQVNTKTQEKSTTVNGTFLGSKNGTKYYTPDCAGAKRIKPENIIWFETREDASLQGYSPAAC